MTEIETFKLALHEMFTQVDGEPSELLTAVERFIAGDCGELKGEDQVLGFMRRSLSGNARHAVYETESYGRVHVMAKNREILVVPDLVYASEYRLAGNEMNICTCPVCTGTEAPEPITTHDNT